MKHVKTLLAFHTVKNHNEKKQFAVVFSVLQNYDIVQKLEIVVADNFDTNNIFCQEIKAYFLNTKNLM